MKRRLRLTESQLNRVILSSAKRIIREMAYGVDFEDTIKWVRKKFPQMRPEEQERFARNIIAKKQRESGVQATVETPMEAMYNPEPEQEELIPYWSEGEIVGYYEDEKYEELSQAGYQMVQPSYSYCHGELEDELSYDVFYIATKDVRFKEKMERTEMDIILSHNGRKCIFRRRKARLGPMGSIGLCVFEDDPCMPELTRLVIQHASH